VIKKKELDDKEREFLRTEMAIIKLLNHPNIVKLQDIFETRDTIYIVLQLVKGGELFDYIKEKEVLTGIIFLLMFLEDEAGLICF
jgi:serine/threonine protein kinase